METGLESEKESGLESGGGLVDTVRNMRTVRTCVNCGEEITVSERGIFHTTSFMTICKGDRTTYAEEA